MFLLHAARLAVECLPQPVTAVEQVEVLRGAHRARLLTHGGAGGASSTQHH